MPEPAVSAGRHPGRDNHRPHGPRAPSHLTQRPPGAHTRLRPGGRTPASVQAGPMASRLGRCGSTALWIRGRAPGTVRRPGHSERSR